MMRTAPFVDTWAMWIGESVNSARKTSRAVAASSATQGIPLSPSSVAVKPSFIWPSAARPRSSLWEIRVMSMPFAYSSARRISSGFDTGLPSSDTATQPASFRSPISARFSPFKPWVMAPTGNTLTRPSACAFAMM